MFSTIQKHKIWTFTIFRGISLFQVTSAGHIHVAKGELVIEEVMPSDGGLYSCMAVSTSGNASRDVAIHSKNLCLSFKLR